MQFDIRMQVATMHKREGFVHNKKQEQLVATAVVASQQIPDADATLLSVSDQPAARVTSQSNRNTLYVVSPSQTGGSCNCQLGLLHYPCKHVMTSTNALQHCSRQNTIPAVQCFSAKQAHSRQCVTAVPPMEICLPYRCALSYACAVACLDGFNTTLCLA